MKITWLKLSVDICDDQKIRRIRRMPDGDAMGWCWIAVLCMAMRSCRPGFLLIGKDIVANASDVASAAEVGEAVAQAALIAFEKLGMIQVMKDGAIEVTNFREHQDLERLEYRRQQATERKRRQRLEIKQKTLLIGHAGQVRDNERDTNVTGAGVTPIKSKRESKREIKSETKSKKEREDKTKETASAVDGVSLDSQKIYPTPAHELQDWFYYQLKGRSQLPSDDAGKTILYKHGLKHAGEILSQVEMQVAREVFEWAFTDPYAGKVALHNWPTLKQNFDKRAQKNGSHKSQNQNELEQFKASLA